MRDGKKNSNGYTYIFEIELHMTALVRILSYVRVSGISKMAACNRKWIYATNLPQILTWKIIRISPVMMLDAKNINISIEISLPSCIQAEIYVIR